MIVLCGKKSLMPKRTRQIILIAHNIRSTHNVGSILRTADAFGVGLVYLTGYSPYPLSRDDKRLPHIAKRTDYQITKTALGAQKTVKWQHVKDVIRISDRLRSEGYEILALEQTSQSVNLPNLRTSSDVALIVGNETIGIDKEIIKAADLCIEIPMLGQKESLNVSVASAIALYHLRHIA